MNLPRHINILMASAVTFSMAVSPLQISTAHAQSAPAAEAPGDSGWQKEFELWRASNKGGKPADYQKYLRVYPDGKFANVAKRRIEELNAASQATNAGDETAAVPTKNVPADDTALEAEKARDVKLWREVSKTGKQADYEKYLKEFPDGKFAKVATTRIENLVAKANAPEDDAADVASKTPAVAADEPAADDDRAAVDSEPAVQEEAQTDDGQRQPDDDAAATMQAEEPPAGGADWEQEYALWKAASDGNTVTEYEAYLRAYPNGKFAAIAQARVVQLSAAEQPDPTIAEGDGQDDAGKSDVAGNRKNDKRQPDDDQAMQDDQSEPADAQDVAGQDDMQGDDTAAADRQNSMMKQGGLNPQQDQQQAQYNEGTPEEEDVLLDREQRHELQGRLSALGYDTQGTDGVFGPRSRDAIASWQQDNGAPVTGYLSEDQIAAIQVASATAYARWLATAAPIVVRRVRPRAEIVYVRPRVVRPRVVIKRRPAVVVVKPFRNKVRFKNRAKFKVKIHNCRKKRRC